MYINDLKMEAKIVKMLRIPKFLVGAAPKFSYHFQDNWTLSFNAYTHSLSYHETRTTISIVCKDIVFANISKIMIISS